MFSRHFIRSRKSTVSNSAGEKLRGRRVITRCAQARLASATSPIMEPLEGRALFSVGFQPPVLMPTGIGPVATSMGDFVGDGKTDVVTANFGNSSLSVELAHDIPNTIGGSLANDPIYVTPLPFHPIAVAAGDFNGDGKADVAVIAQTTTMNAAGAPVAMNQVYWLPGLGNGKFGAPQMLPMGTGATMIQPNSIAVADFNGDGIADLAVYDAGDGSVYLCDGSVRGLVPAVKYASGVIGGGHLGVGDFDGDGKTDVLLTNDTSNVTLLLNDGTGQLMPPITVPTGLTAGGATVLGDFNGDGRDDLAHVDFHTNTVQILLTTGQFGGGVGFGGTPGFQLMPGGATTYSAPISSMTVADFNADGKADLVLAFPTLGTVAIQFGNGDGTLGMPQSFHTGNAARTLMAGDFNGDGETDIVTTDMHANNTGYLINGTSMLTATGQNFTGYAGHTLVNQLAATFSDNVLGQGPGIYSASINWGDGTVSQGIVKITSKLGTFTVVGTHTYASSGAYAVHVVIAPTYGNPVTTDDVATILLSPVTSASQHAAIKRFAR